MPANLVEFAQELKRQVPIEQLLADYLPSLQKRGKSYKALCPFHEEKTASFHVHPEFAFYHCFGCHARGDAIKFVQEFEKIDFRLAVERIAKRFGIPVPEFDTRRSPEERDAAHRRREILQAICRLAEEFYIAQLKTHSKGKAAVEYLQSRGLIPDQIQHYRLGFAPPSYEAFLDFAGSRGYKPESVAEAGLAIQKDSGGFIDRFRNRIMFPIADQHGEVVAFGGRLMDGEGPKYLNSADTPLFHKGKLLYGLVHSREAIREQNRAILLEGYMDWIALHSHGIKNVVAGLGTAFTDDQARLLRRMTQETVLLYDGDEAGQKAMFRATELLLAQGLGVRAAELPAEHDPDSFIRAEGAGAMRELIDRSPTAIDYFLDRALAVHGHATPESKTQVAEALMPLVAAIKDPILKESYLNHLASQLSLSVSTLHEAIQRKQRAPRRRPEPLEGSEADDETGHAEALSAVRPAGIPFDRMECYLLHFMIGNIGRWDLFCDLDDDLIQDGSLKLLFSKVHAAARAVESGQSPPEDWFNLCNSDAETVAMDYILSLGGILASGELRQGYESFDAEQLTEEFHQTVSRLRRRRMQRERTSRSLSLKRNPAPLGEAVEWLTLIHLHSEDIDRHTRRILRENLP